MKKFLGILLSLVFSTQAFASGQIYIAGKDMSQTNMPNGALRIFSVETPLEEGPFDYLTISASASDGLVSVVKVHKNSLKNLQMDVASFMTLTTSQNTNPIVMCLGAELVKGNYVCQRLSINATTR